MLGEYPSPLPPTSPSTGPLSETILPPHPRMIGGVLMGLLFGKIGYYLVLGWCCVSIFVFMVSWDLGRMELRAHASWAEVGYPGGIQAEANRWGV